MTKRKKLSAILLGAILALGVGAGIGASRVETGRAAEEENISFANSTQRQSLDKNAQVWVSGPITMTIEKNTSGNDIADYTNPIRIYVGHKVTFSWDSSVGSIESVVITANSATYATNTRSAGLTNAIATGEGTTATLTATDPTDEMSIVPSVQIRWNSLVVNYTEGAGTPITSSMELDTDVLSIDIAESHQLVPTFLPTDAKPKISYSITNENPVGAVSVSASGLVTGLKQGTATIEAVTNDGSGLDAIVDVTVSGDLSSNILTPAEAHELVVGDDVAVRGKVVADIKNAGAYAIQVGDRGIMTYGLSTLTIGNDVVILGKMAAFNGMPQVSTPASVIDLGLSTTTVTPKMITSVSEFTAKLSGTMVQMNGMKYTSGTFTVGAATNVNLTLGGDAIVIRATKDVESTPINAANAIFGATTSTDTLNVTTVAGWFNGAQLLFSAETTMERIEPPFGAVDYIELDTTNVVTSYYVGESFDLTGLVVTAIDTEGKEKNVTAEAESSLASGYTFVVGDIGNKIITIGYVVEGEPFEETFSITIQAAPAWTKATMAYLNNPKKTTNMNAVDIESNEAIVGLDPDIFTVTSDKGLGGNHVGLNTDGTMRLYWLKDTFEGVILSVSVASGKEISKVVFNFGSTVAKAKILVDGTEEYNAMPTKNTSVTLENLEATSFSIQNINESSSQLYISSIDIYYIYPGLAADTSAVDAFVTNYMHPEIDVNYEGVEDKYNECTTLGYYADAKTAFNALTIGQRVLFVADEAYDAPRARLAAWAIANGDILNTSTKMLETPVDPTQNVLFNGLNDSNTIMLIVIISLISVSVLGGVFYLRKREQN